jgi:hypothetical protein
LGVFSTVTAHPALHRRYSTCTGVAITRPAGFTGFAAGRAARAGFVRVRATRRAAGREPFVRDALIILFSTSPQNTRRARLSIFTAFPI